MSTGTRFVIVDQRDRTYYAGGGDWDAEPAMAERYQSREAAQRAIKEADCEAILGDRLAIVEEAAAPSAEGT